MCFNKSYISWPCRKCGERHKIRIDEIHRMSRSKPHYPLGGCQTFRCGHEPLAESLLLEIFDPGAFEHLLTLLDKSAEKLCLSHAGPNLCPHCKPGATVASRRQFLINRVIYRGTTVLSDFLRFCSENDPDTTREVVFTIENTLMLGLSRSLPLLDWISLAKSHQATMIERFVREKESVPSLDTSFPGGKAELVPLRKPDDCLNTGLKSLPPASNSITLSVCGVQKSFLASFDASFDCTGCFPKHPAGVAKQMIVTDYASTPTFFNHPKAEIPETLCVTTLALGGFSLTDYHSLLTHRDSEVARMLMLTRPEGSSLSVYVWSLKDMILLRPQDYLRRLYELNGSHYQIKYLPWAPAVTMSEIAMIVRDIGMPSCDEFVARLSCIREVVHNTSLDIGMRFMHPALWCYTPHPFDVGFEADLPIDPTRSKEVTSIRCTPPFLCDRWENFVRSHMPDYSVSVTQAMLLLQGKPMPVPAHLRFTYHQLRAEFVAHLEPDQIPREEEPSVLSPSISIRDLLTSLDTYMDKEPSTDKLVHVALDFAVTERDRDPKVGDSIWAISLTDSQTGNTDRFFVRRALSSFAQCWKEPTRDDGRFVRPDRKQSAREQAWLSSHNSHFRDVRMNRNAYNTTSDLWDKLEDIARRSKANKVVIMIWPQTASYVECLADYLLHTTPCDRLEGCLGYIICDLEYAAHKFGLLSEDLPNDLYSVADRASIRVTNTRDIALRTSTMIKLWRVLLTKTGTFDIEAEKIMTQAARPNSLSKTLATPLAIAIVEKFKKLKDTPNLSVGCGTASVEARCLRAFSRRLGDYLRHRSTSYWVRLPLGFKFRELLFRASEDGQYDWSDRDKNHRILDKIVFSDAKVEPPRKKQKADHPLPSTSAFSSPPPPPQEDDEDSFFAVDCDGRRYKVIPLHTSGDPTKDAVITIDRDKIDDKTEEGQLPANTSLDEEEDTDHYMKTPPRA